MKLGDGGASGDWFVVADKDLKARSGCTQMTVADELLSCCALWSFPPTCKNFTWSVLLQSVVWMGRRYGGERACGVHMSRNFLTSGAAAVSDSFDQSFRRPNSLFFMASVYLRLSTSGLT